MRSRRCWTCTGRSSQPDRRVLALSRPGPRGWPDPGPRRAENYFAPDVRITAVRLPSDSGQGVTGGHHHAAANASDLAISASRRMHRAAVIRLALAAAAGLGLNLALFQAFARLPVAVAVAAFGCYPMLVAAWEAASRPRQTSVIGQGMGMCLATVAIIGLVLLIRPDRSVSVPAAGLLLALLAAVLHAAYIVLGRGGRARRTGGCDPAGDRAGARHRP